MDLFSQPTHTYAATNAFTSFEITLEEVDLFYGECLIGMLSAVQAEVSWDDDGWVIRSLTPIGSRLPNGSECLAPPLDGPMFVGTHENLAANFIEEIQERWEDERASYELAGV